VDEEQDSGTHTASWDGRDENGVNCPAGVYFIQLAFDGQMTVRKALHIR
jgi:flagellar hook assembly protein FlgD